MSFQSLYTILGIALAAWALMGSEDRNMILVRVKRLDVVVVCVLVVFLHWQAFANAIPGPKQLQVIPRGFGEEWLGYAVITLTAVFLFLRHRKVSEKTWSTEKLWNYLQQLFQEGSYGRLSRWLIQVSPIVESLDAKQKKGVQISKWDERLLGIFGEAITQPDVARLVSNQSPDIPLKIIEGQLPGSSRFQDLYAENAVRSPFGQVSRECWRLQANYEFKPDSQDESPVLSYFFENANVANDTEIYRSVGEAVLDCIEQNYRYRPGHGGGSTFDFHKNEGELARNPVSIGCVFFRFMLQEAIAQKIEWHMWVFYLKEWAKPLIRAIEQEPEYDLEKEWATVYHYELWLIIDSLQDMLRPVTMLSPAELDGIVFEAVNRQHENGFPLKAILFTLSECWAAILMSSLNDYQKDYFYESVLRSFARTESIKDIGKTRALALDLMANGPPFGVDQGDYKLELSRLLGSSQNWRPNSTSFRFCRDFRLELGA